jgi:ribonucleoside-diphosphate reductase alpha chain
MVPIVPDELILSSNAADVLNVRYLLKDENGNAIETPAGMFRRVAKAAAQADRPHDKKNSTL